jgi:uncharacterized protein
MDSCRRTVLRGGFCLLAALTVLVLAAVAHGEGRAGPPVPPVPTRFVTDGAKVLDADTAGQLEERLRRFEEETSNQFLVFTQDAVPEGTFLEEYTVAAAQAWKVGQKDRRNGLVLFVFPKSRAARFEVGYGLEGVLPDALASRILREEAIPFFSKGEYAAGVGKAVAAAIAATKGEYRGRGPARRPDARRAREGRVPVGLIVVLVLFALPLLLSGRRRGFFFGGPFGGGWGGGGFGGGGGGLGGGGFSGGGGSFGGGGASGDW